MTWFDGNPAHLWQYPPALEGQRFVEAFGGLDALHAATRAFEQKGDYRFAATLLGHAIAAFPTHESTKPYLAQIYEHLGFGAENATWRNFYLTAAQELRIDKQAGLGAGGKTPLGPNLPIDQWFDILSVQISGELAVGFDSIIDFNITDTKQKWRLILSNCVLT